MTPELEVWRQLEGRIPCKHSCTCRHHTEYPSSIIEQTETFAVDVTLLLWVWTQLVMEMRWVSTFNTNTCGFSRFDPTIAKKKKKKHNLSAFKYTTLLTNLLITSFWTLLHVAVQAANWEKINSYQKWTAVAVGNLVFKKIILCSATESIQLYGLIWIWVIFFVPFKSYFWAVLAWDPAFTLLHHTDTAKKKKHTATK